MDLLFDANLLKSHQDIQLMAGTDEVGRGPLAGPVVSATVLAHNFGRPLDPDHLIMVMQTKLHGELLEDSKKLTTHKRRKIIKALGQNLEKLKSFENYTLYEDAKIRLSFALAQKEAAEIDRLNILRASLLSMKESFETTYAIEKVNGLMGLLLVDGNQIPPIEKTNLTVKCVVKGDSHSPLIALSSILAKEYRDFLMETYAKTYPQYQFENHSGYPTKFHKEMIEKYGISPLHRKTFKGVKEFVSAR